MDAIETPTSWFVAGQLVSLVALAWLARCTFRHALWQSMLAVPLAFLLSLVACRVTGETDTTPIGAMGQVTQFTFGALDPGNANLTLMSANITAAAAGSSADLLTDLKSGYLLGANPAQAVPRPIRRHFHGNAWSRCFAFGSWCPTASVLGSKQFPAPGGARLGRPWPTVLSKGSVRSAR